MGNIFTFLLVHLVGAQTWCGKPYLPNQLPLDPGGRFVHAQISASPRLSLRCGPTFKPYLASERTGSILIDTQLTHLTFSHSKVIDLCDSTSLWVKITTTANKKLAEGHVPINTTAFELPFSLDSLQSRPQPYDIVCSASYSCKNNSEMQTFTAINSISRLPDPARGSITKVDARTGVLWTRPAEANTAFEPIIPFGFYTTFGGYVADNVTILNEIKHLGFTVVHLVPTFENLTALEIILDRMEELGLYLMYDMRWTYMKKTAITKEINAIRKRTNLLLWYTADEPDGTSDPLIAPSVSQSLIDSLDGGGLHPVSLALNCADYHFNAYAEGASVILADPYTIGINVNYSIRWHTPCTKYYGCCGCDECAGEFEDGARRYDSFLSRLEAMGEMGRKAVWAVPQAFGGAEHWSRAPTGQEFLVQAILALNHGVLGIIPWIFPTSIDIMASASMLAKAITTHITPFLSHPWKDIYVRRQDRVDLCFWRIDATVLIMGVNMNEFHVFDFRIPDLAFDRNGNLTTVFDRGMRITMDGVMEFEPLGVGIYIVNVDK